MDNTVIIPTLNNLEGLKKCIASILANTDMSRTDILVMANGSGPETIEYLKTCPPSVEWVHHPKPLGFPRAVNTGIACAKGKRVVLLNDDCEVLEWGGFDGWIKMLEEPFKDWAMIATGACRDFWAKDKPFLVFFCTMLDRHRFITLGMLDASFGHGCGEDADFCMRAQADGYKIQQVPREFDYWHTEFPVYHIGHMTCGGIPGFAELAAKNTEMLEKLWPRDESDRQFQITFSKGRQNIDIWNNVNQEGIKH